MLLSRTEIFVQVLMYIGAIISKHIVQISVIQFTNTSFILRRNITWRNFDRLAKTGPAKAELAGAPAVPLLVTDPSLPDPLEIAEYKTLMNTILLYLQTQLLKQRTSFWHTTIALSAWNVPIFTTTRYKQPCFVPRESGATLWCDFVVRTLMDLHIERLTGDPDFWSAAMPRLWEFYFTAVLPELALPNQRKGGIREPSSWLTYGEAWRRQKENLWLASFC